MTEGRGCQEKRIITSEMREGRLGERLGLTPSPLLSYRHLLAPDAGCLLHASQDSILESVPLPDFLSPRPSPGTCLPLSSGHLPPLSDLQIVIVNMFTCLFRTVNFLLFSFRVTPGVNTCATKTKAPGGLIIRLFS